ncbi:DNA-3-methyladenine glycosylase [Candidatus Falkowbacteria bacterium]|nr:DNA-3-methyladenine glycosylase [Candidatus Falkowbacteria bacterium]
MRKIKKNFYNRKTLKVAQEILGKFLVRKIGNKIIAGKIVETEGYVGLNDLASHASRGKTARTAPMFGPPGHAYVYLVYGLNYCFNIVTEKKNYPAAVLIRAIEPTQGINLMRRFRNAPKDEKNITNGPGKLCQALKIDKKLNNIDLANGTLWLEDRDIKIKPSDIIKAKRIGVDYAGKYKNKPWRFYLKGNQFVSKK